MRTIIFILAIALISMSSTCSKKMGEGDQALQGKWKQTETLISPGPIGEWMPFTGSLTTIEFTDDGTLKVTGNIMMNKNYSQYEVRDNMLYFSKPLSTDSLRVGYELSNNQLTLWFPCIEPCGARFKKWSPGL